MSINELIEKEMLKEKGAQRGGKGRVDEQGKLHGKNLTIDTFSSFQKNNYRPLTIERDEKGNLCYRYCAKEEIYNHGERISLIVYLKDGRSVEFLDGTLDHPEIVEGGSKGELTMPREVFVDIQRQNRSRSTLQERLAAADEECIRGLKATLKTDDY